MDHGDNSMQSGWNEAQHSVDRGNKDKKPTDASTRGRIESRATPDEEYAIQTSQHLHPSHCQAVSPEKVDSSPTGMTNGSEERLRSQKQLPAEAILIYAGLELPEYKCNEADSAGQEKTHSAPALNNEPCKAIFEPHCTTVHEHHDISLASENLSASWTFRTKIVPFKVAGSMWHHGKSSCLERLRLKLPAFLEHTVTFIYLTGSMMALLWVATLSDPARQGDLTLFGHIFQLIDYLIHLYVIVYSCQTLMICAWRVKKGAMPPGNIHQDHQQMRLPIDLTFGKATSILANNTDREKIDEEHWTTRLSLASHDKSVHALGQTGRQTVEIVTQSPVVFALQVPAECRSLKVSKLGRTLFACCALSNFVTLAHPSGPVYWGTFVSGTFSTLCSYVELQLPTGLEGGHNDLSIVIMSKSLSGLSMLLSIIFAAGLLKGWLKGREKHAFVMLVLFITPGFCYLANISLIQEGHHWLEGIPLFTNICAMLVHCGITGVRGMQATPPPLLPGPRRPSPAAVRDGGNSPWRSWADAQGRWTP